MNNQNLHVYSNMRRVPNSAQTHYIYDIHPRTTNTPLTGKNAHFATVIRQNKIIPQSPQRMPELTVTGITIEQPAQNQIQVKRAPYTKMDKESLVKYFDNIDVADKIAAETWQNTIVAQLEQKELAKRENDARIQEQIARDATLSYRAHMLTDIQEKNKMIDEITEKFLLCQRQRDAAIIDQQKRTK